MDNAITQIEACTTAAELFAAVNAFLGEVQNASAAFQAVRGPWPVFTRCELGIWLRELKAAAGPQTADEVMDAFGGVFAALRAAVRKLEAIEGKA